MKICTRDKESETQQYWRIILPNLWEWVRPSLSHQNESPKIDFHGDKQQQLSDGKRAALHSMDPRDSFVSDTANDSE